MDQINNIIKELLLSFLEGVNSLYESAENLSRKLFDVFPPQIKDAFRNINSGLNAMPKWQSNSIVVITVLLVVFFFNTLFLARNRFDGQLVRVTVEENSSAGNISLLLAEKRIIQSRFLFDVTLRLMNSSRSLKAGTYYFSPSMSNRVIISTLVSGKPGIGAIKVTIPEGSSIFRIARTLERAGVRVVGGSVDLLSVSGLTTELRIKYPFLVDVPNESIEGYLFPDTYYLPNKITIDTLLQVLLDRFEQVVMPMYNSSGMRKYTLHEIITMASIVEKEAEIDSDRAIIASVFFNRLKNGIALRSCSTVKYALPAPTKRVLYSDLKVNSPYNTYMNVGLPPGPICNPGLASIYAALHPADTKYLYFVSKGDGTHTFSENYEGHLKGIEKLRKTIRND